MLKPIEPLAFGSISENPLYLLPTGGAARPVTIVSPDYLPSSAVHVRTDDTAGILHRLCDIYYGNVDIWNKSAKGSDGRDKRSILDCVNDCV